jgi:hypothetical protein
MHPRAAQSTTIVILLPTWLISPRACQLLVGVATSASAIPIGVAVGLVWHPAAQREVHCSRVPGSASSLNT